MKYGGIQNGCMSSVVFVGSHIISVCRICTYGYTDFEVSKDKEIIYNSLQNFYLIIFISGLKCIYTTNKNLIQ
jgi:hypothetical protein